MGQAVREAEACVGGCSEGAGVPPGQGGPGLPGQGACPGEGP